MSINEKIISALTPLKIPVEPDTCTEKKPVYCVFNYSALPDDFGDDGPGHERYLVQVHLFGPYRQNLIKMRRTIKTLLFNAGLTYPSEKNVSNSALEQAADGQHFVFECEDAEGIEL